MPAGLAIRVPRALGLPEGLEKALASILKPDLDGAWRHVQLGRDDLALLKAWKRVVVCAARARYVMHVELLRLYGLSRAGRGRTEVLHQNVELVLRDLASLELGHPFERLEGRHSRGIASTGAMASVAITQARLAGSASSS